MAYPPRSPKSFRRLFRGVRNEFVVMTAGTIAIVALCLACLGSVNG
jgi:hypothetical protein